MYRSLTSRLGMLAAVTLACACGSTESSVSSSNQEPAQPASPAQPAAKTAQADSSDQIAPAFTLRDHQGTEHSLAALTASGPTVLVFYRGHW